MFVKSNALTIIIIIKLSIILIQKLWTGILITHASNFVFVLPGSASLLRMNVQDLLLFLLLIFYHAFIQIVIAFTDSCKDFFLWLCHFSW